MIAACLKWVDHRPEVDPLNGDVRTDPRTSGPSAADQAALEWALRLGEATGTGVIALTAGPPESEVILREALSVGADTAVRVELPTGASSQSVAAALAAAVPDAVGVVVCGVYSLDRGSGSVPAFLAARLRAAQALGLITMTFPDRPRTPKADAPAGPSFEMIGERRLDGGRRERLRIPTPAVVSVEGSSARLRRAALPPLIDARRAPIEVRELDGQDLATRTSPVHSKPFRPRARVLPAPAAALTAHQRILALTGALVDREPPQTLVLDPSEAATELLDHLHRWGYLR
jgi:electron transfer flavoprotein beta subunit